MPWFWELRKLDSFQIGGTCRCGQTFNSAIVRSAVGPLFAHKALHLPDAGFFGSTHTCVHILHAYSEWRKLG